jgi:hypothetical protein
MTTEERIERLERAVGDVQREMREAFGYAPASVDTDFMDGPPCAAHVWKYHRDPNTPDGPGEVHVYCETCGAEKQD